MRGARGAQGVLALGLSAVAAIVVGETAGCHGGALDLSPLCSAGPAPSGLASARIYTEVDFEGGAHAVEGGGSATLLPGGRFLSPATPTFGKLGFPVSVVAHPRAAVAYASDMDYAGYDDDARCDLSAGSRVRGVHVMDLSTRKEIQGPHAITLPDPPELATLVAPGVLCPDGKKKWRSPHDASYGMAITQVANPAKLYVTTGVSGMVYEFDVDETTGKLTPARGMYLGGYTAGLALSADESRLWVVEFVDATSSTTSSVVEVKLSDGSQGRRVPLPILGAYAVAVHPGDGESAAGEAERVYVTGFRRGDLYEVNTALVTDAGAPDGAVADDPVGTNPEAVVVSPDGKYVFVAASDDDTVVAIDATSGAQAGSVDVSSDLLDSTGAKVPGSSVSALALDPKNGRLYVARSADNAVSVISTEASSFMTSLGAVPVGFYPTGVAVSASSGLVVTNGKGLAYDFSYAEPDLAAAAYEAQALQGSMLFVPQDALQPKDLASGASEVVRNITAPARGDAFTCPSPAPVPLNAGTPSPIQHVVLDVRENKTYDFLLGGVAPDDKVGGAYQIDDVRQKAGKCAAPQSCPLVPNIGKLARTFASMENFYTNSEVSMTGHAWLTASFVNDYLQRAFTESGLDGEGSPGSLLDYDFTDETGFPPAQPGAGTFFTHLLENNVDFRILGELTGIFGYYAGEYVLEHVDTSYPGTNFDLSVSDIDRANYAIGVLTDPATPPPPFVYMELIQDHTYGETVGKPTPASMIANNDAATGLLVDAVSKGPYWNSTAIFIVEDDPQLGYDHIDYHRSICVVASPWVKHGYTSHTHAAFPSLFRTFELILGIPPMNRYDAYAIPLRDLFANALDTSAYTYEPSSLPLSYVQPGDSLESFASSKMDFGGPDRNPLLSEVVWKSLTGAYPAHSRLVEMARRGRFDFRAQDGD